MTGFPFFFADRGQTHHLRLFESQKNLTEASIKLSPLNLSFFCHFGTLQFWVYFIVDDCLLIFLSETSAHQNSGNGLSKTENLFVSFGGGLDCHNFAFQIEMGGSCKCGNAMNNPKGFWSLSLSYTSTQKFALHFFPHPLNLLSLISAEICPGGPKILGKSCQYF